MPVISLPVDASPALRFAGEELCAYLKRMSGEPFTLEPRGAVEPEAAVVLVVDEDLAHDGYRVERRDGAVRLAGGSGRGVLYGAYAWLTALGCCWPLPGEAYAVVPRADVLAWDGPALAAEPAMPRRGMIYMRDSEPDPGLLELIAFLPRAGFNYLFLHGGPPAADVARELNRRELGFEYGGHILPEQLPRERFADHPDWFRQENGRRTPELNYCPASEEAAQAAAGRLNQLLCNLRQQFDRLETLHAWPDDLFGGGWCSCPRCAAYTESEQSLLMLNQLLPHLELGSDTMLAHCAYHTSIVAPRNITAHPRVRLVYAPRERSYRRPLDADGLNEWYCQQLQGLLGAAPNAPAVFEYYHDLMLFRFLPLPLHPFIGEDVRVYLAHGIEGLGSLSFQTYSWWAYAPNAYILGRALWRGGPADDDLAQFCRAMYGPQADALQAYFDALFELCATALDTNSYEGFVDLRVTPPPGPGLDDHRARLAPLVAEKHLDAIEAGLQQALQQSTAPYRERIAGQWALWQYARHETQLIYHTLQATPLLHRAQQPDSTAAEQDAARRWCEQCLAEIDEGTALLQNLPPHIIGSFAREENGALHERRTTYKRDFLACLAALGS